MKRRNFLMGLGATLAVLPFMKPLRPKSDPPRTMPFEAEASVVSFDPADPDMERTVVRISGLDANGERVTEMVTLEGQSPVTLKKVHMPTHIHTAQNSAPFVKGRLSGPDGMIKWSNTDDITRW